ncbi:phage Gp37/Gp68 family protein [bacterium]|nr:MAG: phage Gp37/Gp68 family protein [bacterium]
MTWNPTTGCDKLSAGCKFCYAETMTKRLKGMGQEKYSQGFKFRIHPATLLIPFTWKKPQLVFVNSMSDLFHKDVPLEYVQSVFKVMNDTPQHRYQVLTKRGDILETYAPFLSFTSNIWIGVSVEDERVIDRIDYLRKVDARIRFLSLEPLLSALPALNLEGISWVIVGGESGFKARPMQEEWVEEIRLQCEQSNVPFFFKQWGGKNKKKNGRSLNGRTYDEMPTLNKFD